MYCALSYVWGDQDNDTSDIVITYKHGKLAKAWGKVFHSKTRRDADSTVYGKTIGSSLAAAFRHLRQKHSPITIWADALCINQEDNKEKTWQVGLMTKIYSNATTVHAWLGPTYNANPVVVDAVAGAFDFIRLVTKRVEGNSKWSSLVNHSSWALACYTLSESRTWDSVQQDSDFKRLCAMFAADMRNLLLPGESSKNYLFALRCLSQTEYFSRLWIIQEAGNARDLTFHYGEREAAYRFVFLSLCLAQGFRASETSLDTRNLSAGFDSRFFSCLNARQPRALTLKDILELVFLSPSAIHEAKFPEDLIFGLVGLAKAGETVKVDYSLSVEQVYTSTAQMLLRQGLMDLLIAFKPYCPPTNFPSWTYDWQTKGLSSFGNFKACSKTEQQLAFVRIPGSKPREAMKLGGSKVGDVTAAGDRFSALAKECGISDHMIATGTMRDDMHLRSSQEQQNLKAKILGFQSQFCGNDVDADVEAFVHDITFPEASFWLWWAEWVSALREFSTGAVNQRRASSASEDLFELLLRVNPRSGDANPAMSRGLGAARDVNGLIDLRFWLRRVPDMPGDNTTTRPKITSVVQAVSQPYMWAWGMRPVILDTGYIGYAPENTESGDEIVVFYGVKAPLVIRRLFDERVHKIIGPAYICGVMQGRFLETDPPGQTFTLV